MFQISLPLSCLQPTTNPSSRLSQKRKIFYPTSIFCAQHPIYTWRHFFLFFSSAHFNTRQRHVRSTPAIYIVRQLVLLSVEPRIPQGCSRLHDTEKSHRQATRTADFPPTPVMKNKTLCSTRRVLCTVCCGQAPPLPPPTHTPLHEPRSLPSPRPINSRGSVSTPLKNTMQ